MLAGSIRPHQPKEERGFLHAGLHHNLKEERPIAPREIEAPVISISWTLNVELGNPCFGLVLVRFDFQLLSAAGRRRMAEKSSPNEQRSTIIEFWTTNCA
jgi:hypothetical protein